MIDQDLIAKIGGMLLGTADSIDSVLDRLDVEADTSEVEDALVGISIECCDCGWWMESSELVNDEGERVGCDDCREKEEDDNED